MSKTTTTQSISSNLLDKSGKFISFDKISSPVKVIYFSASWCPICQILTPKLIKFYEAINKNSKRVEIIFLSRDKDEDSFKNHYKEMPWLAINFNDPERELLKAKYNVISIPTLIIIDDHGEVLSKDAVKDVRHVEESDYETVFDKWVNLKAKNNS